MPNDHDPRLRFSGRPDSPAAPARSPAPEEPPPAAPEESTFRLLGPGSPLASGDATVRLSGPGEPAEGEWTRATVLDPDSWPGDRPYEPPAPPPPPAPDATAYPAAAGTVHTGGPRRYGPGVPGPDTSSGTSQTAAVWHGTLRPDDPAAPPGRRRRRPRALRGWLLPLVVLLGVLAWLLWQHFPAKVKVESVAVRNGQAVQGCRTTARVTGTLRTSGGAGTVHYRWRRSDGTVSDELTQRVPKGSRTTRVVLLWSFDGTGELRATATLEVLSPDHLTAATTFRYRCR
jgi:hypothetical protein